MLRVHSVVGFEWERHYFEGFGTVAPVVRVLVDGRDLVEVVRDVEMSSACEEGHPERAGLYVGLWSRELRSPVDQHFMGTPGSDLGCGPGASGPSDKTVLLGCVCGVAGCAPLMARIDVDGSEVVWNDFAQPHRRAWSYSALGPITFERRQYEQALHAIKDAPLN